jgi:hypothetical protein
MAKHPHMKHFRQKTRREQEILALKPFVTGSSLLWAFKDPEESETTDAGKEAGCRS